MFATSVDYSRECDDDRRAVHARNGHQCECKTAQPPPVVFLGTTEVDDQVVVQRTWSSTTR